MKIDEILERKKKRYEKLNRNLNSIDLFVVIFKCEKS